MDTNGASAAGRNKEACETMECGKSPVGKSTAADCLPVANSERLLLTVRDKATHTHRGTVSANCEQKGPLGRRSFAFVCGSFN